MQHPRRPAKVAVVAPNDYDRQNGSDRRTLVTIEVESVEHPIAGRLSTETQPPERFMGWTELLAALQNALEAR